MGLYSTKRISVITARLIAVIFLWMGSFGVLHHTDDIGLPASYYHLPSVGHSANSAPAADMCAACEWTQGVQTGNFSVVAVNCPLSTITSRLPQAKCLIIARLPQDSAPRGPPPPV